MAEESVSPKEVAEFMVSQIGAGGTLYQQTAAIRIRKQFGEDFTYRNKQRNWGIVPEVLAEFKKLTTGGENDLVWVRSSQYWRRRKPTDKPGRMAR
tara:strand:- start:194 stop:481 length:288 start_codon:yes stop_codon:yes gene_type:complete